ncbi:MAG TPA: flagellar basal body rod protein FlgC [Longimicrobiales bacterium]|nr:flagellar basal body rod protein FlgC [Longimicrobiales bacterium]
MFRPLFRSLAIAASGLSAQRRRMDVIAGNIANAETTRTPGGGPYARQGVELAPAVVPTEPVAVTPIAGELPGGVAAGELPAPALEADAGVEVVAQLQDATEGPLVYDPGHPDADASGYVRYPNVRVTDELVDLMDARRAYEANASVFQAMKGMLRKAIEI